VPYYSKQEKENKMTKKYRTKQTVIDEQAVEINKQAATIKDLEAQLAREKDVLSWRDVQLKEQCEKMYNMRAADIVVTVFEEDYVVNHPSLILSQTSLYKEDFYIDQPEMVEKALKLRDSLSEFYQHHNMDVRISVSINSI